MELEHRRGASRTPSKRRAFGSQLSANTPLPSLRQEPSQLPLSKSTQTQKPLTSVKKKKKKQHARTIIFEDDVEARRCASERKLPSTAITSSDRSPYINLDSGYSAKKSSLLLSPPPLYTPGSNDGGRSSADVRRGRNLIDNFNSPSTVNNNDDNDTNVGGSSRVVSFSPRETDVRDVSWTKFTPKIAWRKTSTNTSSLSAPSSTASSTVINTSTSPVNSPAGKMASYRKLFSSSPLSTMSNSAPQPLPPRFDYSEFPTQQLSTHAKAVASPPTFAVQQLSVPTTNELFLIEDVSIGPSEYAIRFPAEGESLLQVEFEPVTVTSGRPTGCGIAKILPGFEMSNACYVVVHADEEGRVSERKEVAVATPSKTKLASLIQVNDLVVSINGVSVLSRKYDFIMELLRKKTDDKIIVFRSIEKIWRSRSNHDSTNQFSTRTMRNLRTGKRVATALNDGMMDDQLHSWVKTPTQVAVGRRRGVVGDSKLDSAAGDNEEFQFMVEPATVFSPSNIKKISLRGNSAVQPSPNLLRSHFLSTGEVVNPLAATVKKSNTQNNSKDQHLNDQGSRVNVGTTRGDIAYSSSHTMERIGKALTGEETRGDKGDEFERSLRLKKDLLNELKNVHSELEVLHSAKERMIERSHHEMSEKISSVDDHAATDIQLSRLRSEVDDLKSERFRTLKVMIDMQAQLNDANSKAQEVDKLATANSEFLKSNKKLEETIAAIQADRDAERMELEKERLARSELTAKLEEEKMDYSRRDASHSELVRSLEERLAAEEQKASESSVTRSSIVAELEKRIAITESERDGYHLELERGRLALSVSECERDGFESDLNKARSTIDKLKDEQNAVCSKLMESEANVIRLRDELGLLTSALDSEKLTTIQLTSQIEHYNDEQNAVHSKLTESEANVVRLRDELGLLTSALDSEKLTTIQLMSQIEHYTSNHKSMVSEQKMSSDIIASVTFEKEEVEKKLRETAAALESCINEKKEETDALNTIIKTSDNQVEILNEKISNLQRDYFAMERKVELAADAITCAEEAAEAERTQFQERDASHIAHVRCIEEKLKSEERTNLESAEAIEKLKKQLVAMQSDCEATHHELEKRRLAFEEMEAANRANLDLLQEQLAVANREYSQSRTECGTLKDSELHLNSMIQSLNRRIGELEYERKSQQTITDKLLVEVKVLSDEVAHQNELQSDQNSLVITLKETQDELTEVRRERDLLDQQIDDLNRDLTITEEKVKVDRESYENEIESLKSTLASAEGAGADLHAMFKALSCELSDKEKSLIDTLAEMESLKQAYVAENKSLSLLVESKTTEIDAIQSVQESLTNQASHLSNELIESRNEKAELSAQLSLLSTQLAEAENDIKRSDAKCADLLTKLDTAEELLDEGDAEIQRLNYECEGLEEQVMVLQHSLKSAEDTVSELRDEIDSLRTLEESMANEMESNSEDHIQSVRDLKQRYDELRTNLVESQNECKRNMEYITDLTSKLHASEETLAEAQTQMKSLIAKLATTATCADDVRSEKDELLKKIVESESEAAQNKDIISDLTSKLRASEDYLAEAQNQMKSLISKLASTSSSADHLRSDNDTLMKNLDESKNLAARNMETITDLKSKLISSQDALAEAQREIQLLASQLSSASTAANDLRSEKDALSKNIIVSENEATRYKEIVSDLTSMLKSSEAAFADAQSKIQSLSTQLERASSSVDDLRSENDALLKNLAESQNEAIRKEDIVFNLEAKLQSSEASLADARSEIQDIEGSLGRLKDEKLTVESELAIAISAMNELQSEKATLTADLEIKSNEVSGLKDVFTNIARLEDSDKSGLAAKISALEMNLVSVKSHLEVKHAENSSLVYQLRESKVTFDDLTTDIRRAESQYQCQIECYENRIKELLLQSEALATTIQKLSDRGAELEAQSLRDKLAHELTTRQASNDMRNLQNALSGTEVKQSLLINEIDALKSALETKESDLQNVVREKDSQLEVTIKTMENEIFRLEKCISSAEMTVRSITSEGIAAKEFMKMELEKARDSFEATKDHMEERIQRLQDERTLLQQTLSRMEDCIRDNEASLAELTEAKQREQDLCIQINEMERLIISSETTKRTLNDHIKRLQDDLNECQQTMSQMECSSRESEAKLEAELSAVSKREQDLRDEMEHLLNSFETTKESMNDQIQRLQTDLNICQQKLSLAKESNNDNVATLESDLSAVKEREQELHEQVKEMEHLLEASQNNSDAQNNENYELRQLNSNLSSDLQARKEEIINLRELLEEGIALNSSLSERSKMNERTVHEQSTEIEQLKNETKLTVHNSLLRESELTRQLEEVAREIKMKEVTIELLVAEKDAIANMTDDCNKVQAHLQSNFHAVYQDLAQLSMNWPCIRKDISNGIECAKSFADEMIKCVVIKFKEKEGDYQRQIELLRSEQLQMQEQFLEVLTMKEDESKASAVAYTSQIQSLEDKIIATKKELSVSKKDLEIAIQQHEDKSRASATSYTSKIHSLETEINALISKNAALEILLQQQEESMSKLHLNNENEMGKLQGECYVATGKLELATIKLEHEKSSFERKIESLQAALTEKCLLNRCLAARLEVESLSKHQIVKLDEIMQTKDDATVATHHESNVNDFQDLLRSRDKSIQQLSIDLSVAHDEIIALRAEVECAKEIYQGELLSLKTDYEGALQNQTEEGDKQLQQARDQNVKLVLKYERIIAEVEACHEHTVDLKAIIIEKNKEIELKEGAIMDLQYKVDFLEAQADGWKVSTSKRPETESERTFSSDDVSDMFAASSKRHESLSADFVKLEEQCLQMEEDFRQRTSMHEAIVDGLESECRTLFAEIADSQNDLQAKLDYIASLEAAKERLEIDTRDAFDKVSELHVLCNSLREEKAAAETLANSVTSAARKLAFVALENGSKLDGFPIEAISLSSWSENMHAIAQYIDYASKANQVQHEILWRSQDCLSDALTPKSKGASNPVTVDLVTQHSDMLDDIKSMKHALASAMASPRLTPLKSSEEEKRECDEVLYANLLRAQEQTESLSLKIASFQDDQMKWKEWEAYYESRIAELEGENQIMKAAALPDDSQEVKMRQIASILIYIFQHRYRRSVMQQAFRAWVSQTRTSKHVVIVKDMAKELAMTRRKVLLLKAHMDDNS